LCACLFAAGPLLANNPGATNASSTPVTLTQSGGTATMANGIVTIVCNISSASLTQINFTYNNGSGSQTQQLLSGGKDGGEFYWETGGFGSGSFVYSPVASGPDYGEMDLFLNSSSNGAMDVHFSMLRGSSGFYVTGIWSHRVGDVAMGTGEERDNIYISPNFTWNSIDAARNFQYNVGGSSVGVLGAPVECSLWTNGYRAGLYEDKYKYSAYFGTERAWGWSSLTNIAAGFTGSGAWNIGIWHVLASAEYYNGGPMKAELMDAPMVNMINGGHYFLGVDSNFGANEVWTRVSGPYFIYCNYLTNTVTKTLTNAFQAAQSLFSDAQAQAAAEATAWPYSWFTNANYAPASTRGTVSGQFVINDTFNPAASAANLWVGLIQQPITTDGYYDFTQWEKPYQFWVKSDSNGNFAISNVIAGAGYTLWAFGPGAAGTFMSQNQTGANPPINFNLPATPFSVTVAGGATNNLGVVTWTPTRLGPTVFEIGYPNRKSDKFRHGDDWWVGDVGPSPTAPSPIWSKWVEYPFDFPNGPYYIVGQSRWSTDWNFVQPVVTSGSGAYNGSSSTIVFNLPTAPAGGAQACLYLAISSDYSGPVILTVNGATLVGGSGGVTGTPTQPLSTGYYPVYDISDTTIREFISGAFSDNRVTFPGTLLVAGQNTINIGLRGRGYFADHFMYDYLRLELTGYVPPAPGGLTAFPGNNCNLLSWPATPGATSYNILRSTTSGGGYAGIATNLGPVCGCGSNNATYLDTNALNGATYYYVVQSVNPVGASANSPQSAATTPSASLPATAPSAPADLVATVGHTNVSLSWSASSGANYYSIWRSTLVSSGGGTSNVLGTIILNNTNTSTTYTDTAVTDGAYYSYFVTAANAGGASPNSAAVAATPRPPPPASAPTGLTINTTTTTNQTSTLSWNPVPGAVGYILFRSTSSTGPFAFPGQYVMSLTETTYANTVALGTYYYALVAMNAGGVSALSAIVASSGLTPTTTALARTAGASPCPYGASLTFQATVSPSPPDGEMVAFYSGAASIGAATTSGGVASLTLDNLPYSASAQSITATYSGDPSYGTSTSAALSQTVTQATLTYVANPAFRLVGAANPTFSGTVTGFVNGETQAGATTGTLAFTTTATTSSPAGSYPIDGSGLLAANYTFVQAAANATALTITTTVTPTTTALALTAGASPCAYGASLTFQATVNPSPPDGETVAFYSGAASIGAATTSGGVASLTLDNLPCSAFAQSITATYPGDPNYGTSTSAALSQTVTQATLTYVANPAFRLVGAANPTFSGTVTGFVNGETQAGATTGTLAFTTTATASSPAGNYPIDGSGLSAGNYNFVQAAANATALTITSNSVATQIKAPNPTALGTGPSWVSGTAPGTGDIALWNATATATGDTLTSMGGAFSVGEIQIAGTVAGAVSITDQTTADVLTLNGATGTAVGVDMSAATQNLTLGTPLAIAANQTWIVAGGRTLTLAGSNNPAFGSNVVTIMGGGAVAYNPYDTPTTHATSSAGAGLVISNSTLSVTLQGTSDSTYYDVFGTNTALTMANSTFAAAEIASSGVVVQTFPSLALYPGTSLFQQATRTANSGFCVGFSVLNRYGGSMADFARQGSGGRAFGSSATGYALAGSGVLGWATEGANDWAPAAGAATLIALPTYVNDTWAAGDNTTVTANDAPASGSTVNSLRFDAPGSFTVTLTGVNTIATGGILATVTNGANAATITGGALTSGNTNADGAGDLIVINNNTTSGGSLILNSILADNGATPVGLTIGSTATASPGGPVVLGGSNTFTGATFITRGVLQLSNSQALQFSTLNYSLPGTLSFGALSAANLGGLAGSGNLPLPSTFALVVGNNNSTTTYSGALSGAGASLTKTGTGTLTLSGANTYTGNTAVNAGTLALTGAGSITSSTNLTLASSATLDVSALPGFTVGAAQTLGGRGFINGAVTIVGALSPGDSAPGALTFSDSVTLAAGSTNIFKISSSPLTNDAVVVLGLLTNGGVLLVTNIGVTPLAGNQSFQLFTAAGCIGAFAQVLLPSLPFGLGWDTNQLNSAGLLSVVVTNQPSFQPPALSAGGLVFTGADGVANAAFWLLASTNSAAPLSNWTPVLTNLFDAAGNFDFTNPPDPSQPQQFFILQLPP
jgi:autotransporter-associated beta strand protein